MKDSEAVELSEYFCCFLKVDKLRCTYPTSFCVVDKTVAGMISFYKAVFRPLMTSSGYRKNQPNVVDPALVKEIHDELQAAPFVRYLAGERKWTSILKSYAKRTNNTVSELLENGLAFNYVLHLSLSAFIHTMTFFCNRISTVSLQACFNKHHCDIFFARQLGILC